MLIFELYFSVHSKISKNIDKSVELLGGTEHSHLNKYSGTSDKRKTAFCKGQFIRFPIKDVYSDWS